MKNINRILLIAVVVTLFSCTCQQKISRLRRNCPDCFTVDTVTKAVPVPPAEMDSFFVIATSDTLRLHDTIFQDTKPVSVWHFYKNDTVWYKVDCKPDTIRIKIPQEKIKYVKADTWAELIGQIKWIALGLIGIALIITTIIILRK